MYRLRNGFCIVAAMLISSSGFAQEATIIQNSNMITKSADCSSTYSKKNACQPKKTCKPKPTQCPCPEPEPCCFFEQGLALDDDFTPPCDVKYGPAYNAPAEINVDYCMDVNVDASFIYWNYYQDAMDVAYLNPISSASINITNAGEILYQHSSYKPGFKVGIGWDTHFDNWAFNADYTWFHHKQSTNAHIPASFEGIYGYSPNTWFIDQSILNNNGGQHGLGGVSSSWLMHMDMLDVVVGRPYYQGTQLTVSPSVGLRGLWIRQSMFVGVSDSFNTKNGASPVFDGTTATSLTRSHNWGVGPKIGMNTHWILWRGLRLDGVMGASILYTRYTSLNHKLVVDIPLQAPKQTHFEITAKSNNVSDVLPTLDLGLGLGYGMYTFRNKFYFDLSARYDFSQFWGQNRMRNFVTGLQGADGALGDLKMHGLTVTLRCDF